MGRHLFRLLRPSFLIKMLRTNATSLYGWDILLKGTLWPGPTIGEKLADVIRSTSGEGHEIGLHAWDHYAWQSSIDKMKQDEIFSTLSQGVDLLTKILGRPPSCSAVPSWKSNDLVLLEKDKFSFDYNSDCRGESIFKPLVNGKHQNQPQIPVTLPTYDEVIGQNGISKNNYNDYLFSLLKPNGLNVLTIHAEVEGIVCESMFQDFVKTATSKGISLVPLSDLLVMEDPSKNLALMVNQEIPGREGWVSCQSSA
jgi:undecaprenyl phosphate-alpha-L-ara4FN deformylase